MRPPVGRLCEAATRQRAVPAMRMKCRDPMYVFDPDSSHFP